MESLHFLQLYWWAVVSLLGALLVFLLFVQGGQTLLFGTAANEEEKNLIIGALGHKWELTYTTLVTFGGAAFASFPLFYSTSFGGAYWLWIGILLLFVIQAVSYEFRNKSANLLGKKTYDLFLFLNGAFGTILLGVAVGTLFTGGNYYLDRLNITNSVGYTVSYWTNDYMGIEAIADPFNLLLGIVIFVLARLMGLLYITNSFAYDKNGGTPNEELPLVHKAKIQTLALSVAFVLLFVLFLIFLFLRTGYSVNPDSGYITPVKYKYFLNMTELVWPAVMLLLGVAIVLTGLAAEIFSKKRNFLTKNTFYIVGLGVVLAVWSILICAAFNDTAYFPSKSSLQDSLTLYNSSSSYFTLKVMAYVSIAVPFVLAYIIVVWRKMNRSLNTKRTESYEA